MNFRKSLLVSAVLLALGITPGAHARDRDNSCCA